MPLTFASPTVKECFFIMIPLDLEDSKTIVVGVDATYGTQGSDASGSYPHEPNLCN